MFGVGLPELIVIMVVALLVFGPERLPEIAGQVGRALRDIRRLSDELTGEVQRALSPDAPPAAGDAAPANSRSVGDTLAQSLRVEALPADPAPTTPGDDLAARGDGPVAAAAVPLIDPTSAATRTAPTVDVADRDAPAAAGAAASTAVQDTPSATTGDRTDAPARRPQRAPSGPGAETLPSPELGALREQHAAAARDAVSTPVAAKVDGPAHGADACRGRRRGATYRRRRRYGVAPHVGNDAGGE